MSSRAVVQSISQDIPTLVQLISRGPMGPAGPPGAAGGAGSISVNTSFTVGPSGDFVEPGLCSAYLAQFRILPGVVVTVSVASGTYVLTKPILGHVDGQRIVWTNAGLNGAPLVGADFASLDSVWVIDTTTGVDDASVAAAKLLAEPIVRAKYKVIFECSEGVDDPAVRLDGLHSGDWTACPCLFINVGGADTGVTTGGNGTYAEGDGGRGIFNGSCFFGFDNVNHLCDYGGSLTFHNGLSLFGTQDNCRNDFGGIMLADHLITIGGHDYGYRSNHGGSCYFDYLYARGCNSAIEVTNSPGMAWAHHCDIQYCWVGVQVSWNGSAKVFDGVVKNNARYDLTINGSGSIDARNCNCATTATFAGAAQALWGLYAGIDGSINFSGGTTTGHVTDAQVQGGAVFAMPLATYGTIKAGSVAGQLTPVTGLLQYAPTGRPDATVVEMAGTNLVIPAPAPKTLSVKQPTGSAGTPISILTIDITNMPIGENIAIQAVNSPGETITITDSSSVALAAPTRVLANVRDVLILRRLTASAVISEQSFNKVNANLAFDLASVGTFGINAPTAKTGAEAYLYWDSVTKEVRYGPAYANLRTRIQTASGLVQPGTTDDCVVINKTTPANTAVSIPTAANVAGRLIVIKDGAGNANTFNITITPTTGTIDGAANKVINTAFGFSRLIYNGAEWNAI